MTPLLAHHLRTDRSFERMYRRYVPDVYHYALAICRNETDAEDVTQTTFLNAFRAVQAGEQPRTPKNWLIAIAHNVCRQRFRQAARRPISEDVTQTTFLNAFRAVQAGEQPRTPKNWLIAIAHNVCRQRFRQAARRP